MPQPSKSLPLGYQAPQDTVPTDPHFSRSQNPAQLLSLFQTSQDTSLPESTPQTIGSFPRNFHEHLPPQDLSEMFPLAVFLLLQKGSPCHAPGPPIPLHCLHPTAPLHSWPSLTLPYSSSGVLHLTSHTPPISRRGPPRLHIPKEFRLSVLFQHRLLAHVLPPFVLPTLGPLPCTRKPGLPGLPKVSSSSERSHTFTPPHLPPGDLAPHPWSPQHSRHSVPPVQTLRNTHPSRAPGLPLSTHTGSPPRSRPRLIPGHPRRPLSPTRGPSGSTSKAHLVGDGMRSPSCGTLGAFGSLVYKTPPSSPNALR